MPDMVFSKKASIMHQPFRIAFIFLACWMASATQASWLGDPIKPYVDLPDDKPREHVETVSTARHEYTILFRGTVDGVMTRMPIGHIASVQGWQPNRSLKIENIGTTEVHNPWIVVNGRRDWRAPENVLAEAIRGYTQPADIARAIWEFRRRNRFHACTYDRETGDVLKSLCVYGYTLCGDEGSCIKGMWNRAGLITRRGFPMGHCAGEVFFDDAFHHMDSDMHVIVLKRDNLTLASEADMVRDHDLVKRTHTYGINVPDCRKTDEFVASLYGHQGPREGQYASPSWHRLDFTLRPGESIEYRWDHIGKQYSGSRPYRKDEKGAITGAGDLLTHWGPVAYDNMRNGKICYRPDLRHAVCREGIAQIDHAALDLATGTLSNQDRARPGRVAWTFASPYVFVGGKASCRVRLGPDSSAEWLFSQDGKSWTTVASRSDSGQLVAILDEKVSPRLKPMYRLWLQLVLNGEAEAESVAFEHDIQTAMLCLPELEVGTNHVEYSDSTQGARQVRITHAWLERDTWHPPKSPSEGIAPRDGATVGGTLVAFRWNPPVDPDGDTIVDYHFELSEYPDMRWPLSPNFEKLLSMAQYRGNVDIREHVFPEIHPARPEWQIPYSGLLNPDTIYYWRVRARDDKGVWGPWSKIFSFRIQAPGVPVGLKLVAQDKHGLKLQWRSNPDGPPPVAFKVYGSNEKGFTASDTKHLVFRGKGFVRDWNHFASLPGCIFEMDPVATPSNLIATVKTTSLDVVGPEVKGPNVNSAFYRVVAIDAEDNASGPSDYVEVPRPFVHTPLPRDARKGAPFEHRLGVIRSDGDLQCRQGYHAAFWDREHHTFTATTLPEWLSLDPRTGTLTGRPTKAGESRIVIIISDQFGKSTLFEHDLHIQP